MQNLAARFQGVSFLTQLRRAVVFVVIGFTIGCDSNPAGLPSTEDELTPTLAAAVITVEFSAWPQVVRSQGSLVADEVTVLGAKVAGRVAEVHVDLGDQVTTGQPLVTLDQQEFRLHVQQAEAQLSQARSAVGLEPGELIEQLDPSNAAPVREERAVWDEAAANLKRADRLEAENAISALEYDQIVAAERVAEARYASAVNGVREKMALIEVNEAELSLARQRLREALSVLHLTESFRGDRSLPVPLFRLGIRR